MLVESDLRICSCCQQTRKAAEICKGRNQCVYCRRARTKERYWRPERREAIKKKRQEYQSRPEVIAARHKARSTPEAKAREKVARDTYRSRPEVALALKLKAEADRANPRYKAQALFSASLLRSRERGMEFDLTRDWVMEKVLAGRCELTGMSFDFGKAPNGWKYNPQSPSIDRINSARGYTMDNCRVILTSLNNALSQYGDKYFEEVAIAYLKARGLSVS